MTKKPDYSDEYRAAAIAALVADGWPDRKGALSHVATVLGIPAMTLSRWARGVQNPVDNQLVNEVKGDMADRLEAEIYAILDLMPEKRERASYSQLSFALGTLIEKMRLLRDMPTEIVRVMPDLISAMEKNGINVTEAFTKMRDKLRANLNDANR